MATTFSVTALTLALGAAAPAGATVVTLGANNSTTTPASFSTAFGWSNASAPSAGNSYVTNGFQLRTVDGSGSQTFQGDKVTINNGSLFVLKSGNGATVTVNDTAGDPGGLVLNNGVIANGGSVSTGTGGTVAVTLAGLLTVEAGGGTFNAARVERSINIQSQITGSGPITVQSTVTSNGVVAFANSGNDYTGSVTVQSGGLLRQTASNALSSAGTGIVTVNGSLQLRTGALATTASTDAAINGLAGTGSVTNGNSASTLTIDGASGTNTFDGTISGTQLAVTKTGAGTQVLTGANSYGGGTEVNEGTLRVSGSGTAGTGNIAVTGSGTLDLADLAGGARSNALTLDGRGDSTAHVDSTSGVNALSGNISLQDAGDFTIDSTGTDTGDKLTLSGNIADTDSANHTLDLGGAGDGEVTGTVTLDGTGTDAIDKEGAGTWTISGNVAASDEINVNAGKLVLSGANTYTGGTTIDGGTLELTGAGTAGSSSGTVTVSSGGGTLALTDLTGGARANAIDLAGRANSTAHIDSTSGANGLSGDISLDGSTGANVNVVSSGTATGDALTISGAVTVADANDHTLDLGGAGDGLASGAVTLDGTGTDVLKKSGAGKWEVSGAVTSDEIAVDEGTLLLSGGASTGTVDVTGGSLNLGSTLTTSGNVTIDSGSMLSQIGGSYIDATKQAGGYIVNGTLNLNGQDGSVNWLNGAGIVDSSSVSDPTLTIGNSDGNDATGTSGFSGTVQDTGGAAVSISKVGTNAQDLGTVAIDGNIDVADGGDLTVGMLTKAGNLTVGASSTLGVTGNATDVGNITVNGGSTFNVGGTTASAGAVTVNDGSADFGNDATVGAVTVASGSSVAFNSTGATSGTSTGTIDNSGTLTADDNLTVGGNVANSGSMTMTAGGKTLHATGSVGNSGTLDVGGALAADGGLTNSGTLTVDGNASSGGAVSLTGSSATFSGNLNAGSNTVTASGGTNAVDGSLTSGAVTVANAGTGLTLAGANNIGTATVTGGTLTVKNSAALAGTGNTTVSGGQVALDGSSGDLTVDEVFELMGRTDTGVQLNNVAGANTITAAAQLADNSPSGDSSQNFGITSDDGVLTLNAGVTSALSAGDTATLRLGGASTGANKVNGLAMLTGSGNNITKLGSGTWEVADLDVANAQSIHTQAGVLNLTGNVNIDGLATEILVDAGATLDVSAANSNSGLTLSTGQTLGGNGLVNGDIIAASGATVSAGNSIGSLSIGSLSFGNDLTIDGTLLTEVSGGQIDYVDVAGLLDITNATLDLTVLAGVDPTWLVLAEYGSLGGAAFDNIIISNGWSYQIDYAYDDGDGTNNIAVYLTSDTPVPSPGPLALIGIGTLIWGSLRRRVEQTDA